jgi:hypothetical protein
MARKPAPPEKKLSPLPARFTATEKAALEKAARDDARPVASLMTKIICDWLRERKYLK